MWHPDVTVAAICEQDGRFLIVEERSKSSQKIVFNQPAGHLEDGESLLQAVIRETLEETQRHFTPHALIGLYRLRAATGKTYIRYAFSGSVSEPDHSTELDSDIIRTHWLSLDDLCNSDQLRSTLVIKCIQDYRAGKNYPLNLLREIEES